MKLRLNLSTTPQENQRPFIAGAAGCRSRGPDRAAAAFARGLFFLAVQSRPPRRNRALAAGNSRRQPEAAELETYFHTPAAKQVIDRSAF